MKNIFATTLFLITYVVSAQIDSFDDFVKSPEKELVDKSDKKYKRFIDKSEKGFKEFLQSIEISQDIYKKFSNGTWGNDNYEEGSPIIVPLPNKTKERSLPKDDYLDIMPSNIVNKLKEVYKRSNIKDKNINFFGSKINFYYTNKFPSLLSEVAESEINRFVKDLSDNPYFLDWYYQVLYYSQAMGLNDWGFIQMLKKGARIVYPSNINEQNLLVWFGLRHSEYNSQIHYNTNHVFISVESTNRTPLYITKNGKKYIILTFDEVQLENNSMMTLSNSDNKNLKPVELYISKDMNLINRERQRVFEVTGNNNEELNITLYYNQSWVDFFESVPRTDFEVYSSAPFSPELKKSLIQSLTPHISELSETEKVQYLLSFIHKNIKYKKDSDHFGEDIVNKTYFPEQMLFYDFADSEDNAFFFASLIKIFTRLKVIGLYYHGNGDTPGHVNTAVHFNKQDIKGDIIIYNNEEYIVCDPTYYGSIIGTNIPGYKNVQPDEIIPIRTNSY